ncbi:hypothetical protein L211DRAFT_641060 [Terfezia boudieri ATCC MYA-4762]|uniref:SAM domain-containing protein n=1 Tax=Terfezia boudieri ATCC MYA-4762 TaxID=1051890 RepID=A0A3N4LMS0_9PEZI|nr:hypothetical protein L211DRAFT_641060 [Terfezia boudieri ATCC MYA-4762]
MESPPLDSVTIPNGADNNPKKWKQNDVLAFLKVNQGEYYLTDHDIGIIQREQVCGRDFLRIAKKDLFENPYNLPAGVASRIELLINTLKQRKSAIIGLDTPRWNVLEEGPLTKRRRLDEVWKDYTATCGQSVELPQFLIDMLIGNTFVPEPRSKFLNVLQNAQPGHLITMSDLGDCPKGFREGYLQNPFVVTQQMVEMWRCCQQITNVLSSGCFQVRWAWASRIWHSFRT